MWRTRVSAAALLAGILLSGRAAHAQFEILVTGNDYPLGSGQVAVVDRAGNVTPYLSGIVTAVGLALDSSGNLFLSDTQGKAIWEVPANGDAPSVFASQFKPYAMVFDPADVLYVTVAETNKLRKYARSGELLREFNLPGSTAADVILDKDGNLLIANLNSAEVRKLSPTGQDLGVFAAVLSPLGLAEDAAGNVYVSALGAPGESDAIYKFSPSGQPLGVFATSGVDGVHGMAFDPSGNLYVANNAAGEIRKYSPTGEDLGEFAHLSFPVDLIIRPASVPEPGTLALLLIGGLGAVAHCWRRWPRLK